MVHLHPSCASCEIPGDKEKNHEQRIKTALYYAKELIDAGHEAVRGEDPPREVFGGLFDRYFGTYTKGKYDRVRTVFKRMRRFDTDTDDDPSKDITIVLDNKHLSYTTKIYLPDYKLWYRCIIDHSCQSGFDKNGMLVLGSKALIPADLFPRADNVNAFVCNRDDPLINFEGGKHIWLLPRAMSRSQLQGPFDGMSVHEGDYINNFFCLPTTLFHELTHTVLMGPVHKRLTDAKVVPVELSPLRFEAELALSTGSSDTASEDPTKPACMYGDDYCSRAARKSDEAYKTFSNADSYKLFALGVWFWNKKKKDFSSGYAVSRDPS